MELATTREEILDSEIPQMLTVGDLMEKLKDENPDTPLAFLTPRKLNYIHGASPIWVTGDGALRVIMVF